MRTFLLGFIFMITGPGLVIAQDSVPEQPAQKPLAKTPFESGYFIADQTVHMSPANTLEIVIQHDFGTIQEHWSDLWGIWGASNIRLGVNYTITKDIQVGFGTTKNKLLQDFSIKYTFLRQRQGGFPLTISFYGNVAIDARNKSFLSNNTMPADLDYMSETSLSDSARVNLNKAQPHTLNQAYQVNGVTASDKPILLDYTFKAAYRFSYFGELMFARRFCKEFSAQFGISWVHYNLVDSTEMAYNHVNWSMRNNNINLSGIGRIKVSPQTSVILSYSQPILTYLNTPPWPNIGLGVEISTSTHAFQIFLTAANGLVPQETVMYNYNNPYNGYILLGFNITRLWTF